MSYCTIESYGIVVFCGFSFFFCYTVQGVSNVLTFESVYENLNYHD